MTKSPQAPNGATESPHALRPAGEAVKAFREYLAVHEVSGRMDGRAMDDMALDLARIALNFQAQDVDTYMACDGQHQGECCEARYCWLATNPEMAVRQAVRDYHFDLDNRVHGVLAADKALKAIEAALGTHWVQGKERAARAARGEA